MLLLMTSFHDSFPEYYSLNLQPVKSCTTTAATSLWRRGRHFELWARKGLGVRSISYPGSSGSPQMRSGGNNEQ